MVLTNFQISLNSKPQLRFSMKQMILPLSLVIFFVVFLFLFWRIFIRPLFAYQKKLSHEMRESVFPSIANINNTIITLATAGIVLTLPLLKDGQLIGKEYLIASWASFSLSILAGILILVAHFAHRFTDKIMIGEFERLEDKPKNPNEAVQLLNKQQFLTRILFVFIYLQVVLLFASVVSLVVFGVENLIK